MLNLGRSWDHPIPLGVRLGNLVVSSIIAPQDPETGRTPTDVQEQVRHLFRQMKALMEDAGGTVNDIARVSFFVRSKQEHRPLIDEEWANMFPAGGYRPARIFLEVQPQGSPSVQCEIIGVVGGRT
jgi:enamine deaminase RidA (YjgF/YER057c/UK114 family)